jgi:hypothetical protein
MFLIPFLRYHRPNAHQTTEQFECDNPLTTDLAKKIIGAGGRFESEVLGNGKIAFSVSFVVEQERMDIAIRLSDNNKTVVDAIDDLTEEAWAYINSYINTHGDGT